LTILFADFSDALYHRVPGIYDQLLLLQAGWLWCCCSSDLIKLLV
jgi:hypothetical protein